HDDRGAFVKATDEVEQELATRLGERQISQLVEDQEVEAAQEIRGASLSVGAGFGVQLVHQVHDVEEAAALATADAGPGDADGKVGFAGPGAADEDDVTLMLEELSGGQIAHQRFVYARVFEAELVDFLGQGQLGDGHLVFDRASLYLADLGVQRVAHDLLRFVVSLRRRQ